MALTVRFTDAEQQLGLARDAAVYAAQAYSAARQDELSLSEGERLTVLRRGDESETDWWWARRAPASPGGARVGGSTVGGAEGVEGYVPKNLLAVRVTSVYMVVDILW